MSDYSGIYLFFALFCGTMHYDPQITTAAYVIEQVPEDQMGIQGFPPPWSGLPGADPEYYDI